MPRTLRNPKKGQKTHVWPQTEKVAPTKLFYPKWWLDQVGFFDSDDDGALEGGSLEQEVAKAMPSVTSLVMVLVVSHLSVLQSLASCQPIEQTHFFPA